MLSCLAVDKTVEGQVPSVFGGLLSPSFSKPLGEDAVLVRAVCGVELLAGGGCHLKSLPWWAWKGGG
jgi:hypothetical protein